jgi:hypothetical protein
VVTEGTPNLAKVSIAPDGAVTLAGLKNTAEGRNGPGCKEINEYGSVRPPSGTFAKATGVGTACGPTGSAASLQIAGDSAGDTLAIWQESTTIGENVRGFVYDVGPSIGAVAIPTTAQVGQPVSFSMASPVSLWTPVTGLTWTFGDGTTAGGLSTTHTYTQPGEYHVTVSAADAQLLAPIPRTTLLHKMARARQLLANDHRRERCRAFNGDIARIHDRRMTPRLADTGGANQLPTSANRCSEIS